MSIIIRVKGDMDFPIFADEIDDQGDKLVATYKQKDGKKMKATIAKSEISIMKEEVEEKDE